MRFVPVKTMSSRRSLTLHRGRDLLVRQRTALINAIRGHLAEFGIIEAQGLHKRRASDAIVQDETDNRVPAEARDALSALVGAGRGA